MLAITRGFDNPLRSPNPAYKPIFQSPKSQFQPQMVLQLASREWVLESLRLLNPDAFKTVRTSISGYVTFFN